MLMIHISSLKLQQLGIVGSLLILLSSYLSRCSQEVLLSHTRSYPKWKGTTYGVPQESFLALSVFDSMQMILLQTLKHLLPFL